MSVADVSDTMYGAPFTTTTPSVFITEHTVSLRSTSLGINGNTSIAHPVDTWNIIKNDYSSRWNSGDIREMGSVVGEGLITLLTAGVKYADNAGRLGKTGAFIQKLRKIKNLKRLRKLKALKSEFRKGPGHMTRLRYEGASYHGKVKVGGKNPAPINDQAALDTLLQIKPTSPRRIGIDYDSGSFSVFDQTTEGVFHGHTRTWSELTDQMQRTLRQSGMVNGKGVIH
jgi:hypothetical protein